MNVELKIDKNIKENKVVIYASEANAEITDLVNKLQNYSMNKTIVGQLEGKNYLLDRDEIECFYSEESKILARANNKVYKVKYRLRELEELLENTTFIRISKYEIANFNKVESLDINANALICLKYKSGEITYVSRRNVKKIKEYLGI